MGTGCVSGAGIIGVWGVGSCGKVGGGVGRSGKVGGDTVVGVGFVLGTGGGRVGTGGFHCGSAASSKCNLLGT